MDSNLKIHPVKALNDNYIWTLINRNSKEAVIVDPGEAEPILQHLRDNDLTLKAILITHHHWDHTNGIEGVLRHHNVPVYGPKNPIILNITNPVSDGATIKLDSLPFSFEILAIPGHTLDHIAYYTPGILFCGDTLFASGCGKIFEGTGLQMYESIQRLANLPENTKIYCAHEYTENNLKFAQTVEPNNADIQEYLQSVSALRHNNQVTLPSTLSREKLTNPFLRCREQDVATSAAQYANTSLANEVDVFIALREWKDIF